MLNSSCGVGGKPDFPGEKRRAVQSQQSFRDQLNVGATKFYELLSNDPRFPIRFKIGKGWVYYIDDCNEYIRQCAETTAQSKIDFSLG